MSTASPSSSLASYNRLLLFVAGLGGLLYGVDVGIIASALPYLEATSNLTSGQESFIVAAVLWGSVISTLFAGLFADWMGRRLLMAISGVFFVASIPTIALSHDFNILVLGRLLQGVSGGFIGVVVPLYLAECLSANDRGKGTGIFQWLLTLGISAAAGIGIYFSYRVKSITALHDPTLLFGFKDTAWRSIFWASLPPGLLFVGGSMLVAESPRWLHRHGKKEAARAALLRSRTPEQTEVELNEMDEMAAAEAAKKTSAGAYVKESLLSRRYVIPFVLACVILACNQATGINSIIGYNTTILLQSGLSDLQAHWGYFIFTCVNFLVTTFGVALVDKKGRKFLLSLGSAGIIVILVCIAFLFHRTESRRVDCAPAVQAMVAQDQTAKITLDPKTTQTLLASAGSEGAGIAGQPFSMVVIYSCGDFQTASKVIRSDDPALGSIELSRDSVLPQNKTVSFFSNPFANLDASRSAPLKVDHALLTPIPSENNGWLTLILTLCFVAFFAVGPGICVWLALSELMPTRIRSNGMSVALLINQAVSATIGTVFLPTVGAHGYSTMFFGFAGATVIYFITAFFFLPETKGKTLEEIEAFFEKKP